MDALVSHLVILGRFLRKYTLEIWITWRLWSWAHRFPHNCLHFHTSHGHQHGGNLICISLWRQLKTKNLIEILGYNLTSPFSNDGEISVLTYHRIIEAFKFSYAWRSRLGDPDFNSSQIDKVSWGTRIKNSLVCMTKRAMSTLMLNPHSQLEIHSTYVQNKIYIYLASRHRSLQCRAFKGWCACTGNSQWKKWPWST